jgi:uncharacterized protein
VNKAMKGTNSEVLVKVVAVIVVVAILLIIIFVAILPALKEDERFKGIPDLEYYVTDDDYVIIDRSLEIEDICYFIDENTSCEMAVLVVNDTGDRSANEFALRTFQKNEIGKEGKDNGVLLLLVISTREWKVEVGYGLEGVLTPTFIDTTAREQMEPWLAEGFYGDGVYNMVLYMGAEILDNYEEPESGDPAFPIGGIPLTTTGWIIVIIVIVALTVVTKGRIWYILIFLLTGGRGKGGFGGGRSGGGGGGGRF